MTFYELNYLPQLPRDRSAGIGCIGSGFIMADCHLVAYRQAGFNPVAIAARNLDRTRQVADRHAIPNVYEDYRELLDDRQVQVVDIAVPPDVQFEIIREITQRRGHVRGILAQKPLGINYAQAKSIVQMCQDAGITLAVNQNMRFDQSIRAMKSLLDQRAIGEPVLATIDMRAIPQGLKQGIGKTQSHKVLHGFFAEIVIDAVDCRFFKNLTNGFVENAR